MIEIGPGIDLGLIYEMVKMGSIPATIALKKTIAEMYYDGVIKRINQLRGRHLVLLSEKLIAEQQKTVDIEAAVERERYSGTIEGFVLNNVSENIEALNKIPNDQIILAHKLFVTNNVWIAMSQSGFLAQPFGDSIAFWVPKYALQDIRKTRVFGCRIFRIGVCCTA